MANEQNLKNFPPGVSGNPKGRPKGSKNFSSILNGIIERKIDIKDPLTLENARLTAQEALMLRLVSDGLNGNILAIREIMDRVDGKTKQTVEIENISDPRGIYDKLGQIAEREGLTVNELCRREGISTEELG